jgi:hypothetical protein
MLLISCVLTIFVVPKSEHVEPTPIQQIQHYFTLLKTCYSSNTTFKPSKTIKKAQKNEINFI